MAQAPAAQVPRLRLRRPAMLGISKHNGFVCSPNDERCPRFAKHMCLLAPNCSTSVPPGALYGADGTGFHPRSMRPDFRLIHQDASAATGVGMQAAHAWAGYTAQNTKLAATKLAASP